MNVAKGVFATRDGPTISSVTGDGSQISRVIRAGLDITRATLKPGNQSSLGNVMSEKVLTFLGFYTQLLKLRS